MILQRIKHYLNLLKKKDYWTWGNFKGVLQAYFRKSYSYMGIKIPKHVYEQIEWRKTKAKKCLENVTCLNCDCYIAEKLLEDRGCSISEGKGNLVGKQLPCYPEMMSKDNWEIYKKINHEIN